MAKKKKPVADQKLAPMPSVDSNGDEYETKRHLETLTDAEKIKQDPEKMKKVHKMAGRHAKAIRSIQQLVDFRNQKHGKEEGPYSEEKKAE